MIPDINPQPEDDFNNLTNLIKKSKYLNKLEFDYLCEKTHSLNELGFDYHAQGEFNKAEECHNEAWNICQDIKNSNIIKTFYNTDELSKYIRDQEANSLQGLGNTYVSLNQPEKAVDFYKKAAEIRRDIEDLLGEARALLRLAATYQVLGRYEEAIQSYEESYNCLRWNYQLADNRILIMAQCQNQIGFIRYKIGQNPEAIENHREALQLSGHTNRFPRQAEALQSEQTKLLRTEAVRAFRGLGDIYDRAGHYQEAINNYQQARDISEEINDLREKALALLGLGDVQAKKIGNDRNEEIKTLLSLDNTEFENVGSLLNSWILTNNSAQYSEAIKNLQEAQSIFQKIGDIGGEANAANLLGNVYCSIKEYPQATQFYQRVLQICTESKDEKGKAVPLHNLGLIAYEEEKYKESIDLLQQSLAIGRGDPPINEVKTKHALGDAYNAWGQQYYEQRQYESAIKLLNQGLEFFQKIDSRFRTDREQNKDRVAEARTQRNLGDSYSAWGQDYYKQKQYKGAVELLRQGLDFFQSIDPEFRTDNEKKEDKNARDEAETYLIKANEALGRLYSEQAQYQKAIEHLKQMLKTMRELGNQIGEATALLGLGNVYHSTGKYGNPDNPDLVSHKLEIPTNASEAYQQALEIFKSLDSLDGKIGHANVLLGLGKTYHSLGQCKRAIEYLDKGDI